MKYSTASTRLAADSGGRLARSAPMSASLARIRSLRQAASAAVCLLAAAVLAACGGGEAGPSANAPATSAAASAAIADAAGATSGNPALASGGRYVVEARYGTAPRLVAGATGPTGPTPANVDKAAALPGCSCGPDIGGWTTPVPSPINKNIPLKSLAQPGSRLHYISAARGSDQAGELYFWDGRNIIDANGSPANSAGQAYGTDPLNPSAAVRPFRRWAYVAPRARGTDIGTPGLVGPLTGGTRAGFPDWWLFARGETIDLGQDLLSFEHESNPSATTLNSSLMVPGGRSAAERQVVGAYGDPCLPRPRFVHPLIGFVHALAKPAHTLKHVAYLSLHFDGHERRQGGSYGGITLLYQPAASVDILFEDLWLDAATVNIGGKNAAEVTFRRSLLTDAYSVDGSHHVQGIYYEGAREGRLRIEESILLRNGFRGDPKTMVWPPAGEQIWNIYNRNLYIAGEIDPARSGLFDSISMLGTSGDQFRPGMRLERNFFYQGYVTLGAYGGYPDSAGPSGTIVDNVLQRFVATGTTDNRGHPGWGFGLTSGAYGVEVARNIVTGVQYNPNEPALQLSPLSWVCYAHVYRYPTRRNRIYDNIFESGAVPGVGIEGGVTGESPPGCAGYSSGGVQDNAVFNNVMITSAGREAAYTLKGLPSSAAAVGLNAATFTGNTLQASRAAAAGALGWPAANRSLKTYLQANGVQVISADGFPEFFERAVQQRRGNWRSEWTSRALNNYVRGGYSMAPLQ